MYKVSRQNAHTLDAAHLDNNSAYREINMKLK